MKLKLLAILILANLLAVFGGRNFAYAYLQQNSVQCWPPGSTKTVDGRTYQCVCQTVSGVYYCFWVGLPSPNDENKVTMIKWRDNAGYGDVAFRSEAVNGLIDHFSLSAAIVTPAGNEDVEPAGSFRLQMIIQKYEGGSWVTKKNTSYMPNTVSASAMHYVFNMGSVPDWGSGTYRFYGLAQKNDGGSWVSAYGYSSSIFMDGIN